MKEKWTIIVSGLQPTGPAGNELGTDESTVRSAVCEMIEQAAYHSNLDGYGEEFAVEVDVVQETT